MFVSLMGGGNSPPILLKKGYKMFEYVKTKELSIFFDRMPKVNVRTKNQYTTKDEAIAYDTYPFSNKYTFQTIIIDHIKHKKYHFTITKGYSYDGLTIPRFAWTLLGISKEDNRGLIGAMLHDKLCENKSLVNYDRKLSTKVLKELIIIGGIPRYKANIMAFVVDIFQSFQKEWYN